MKHKSKIMRTLLLLVALMMSALGSTNAQLPERASWKGQYDIRMISAPALQPVWIKYGATNMDVVRPVTTAEQLHCGRRLIHNNDLGGTAGAQMSYAGGLSVAPTAAKSTDGKNFQIGLAYADIDDDMQTFQSSGAVLDFGAALECTTIEAAYLYWQGTNSGTTNYAAYPGDPSMNSHAGGATGNATGNNVVLIKAPQMTDYEEISAVNGYTVNSIPQDGNDRYVNCADITKYIKGKRGGLYTVANIRSSSNAQSSMAGWSLVVIFTPPNCPPRTIKLWDGFADVGGNGPDTRNLTLNFDPGEVPATGNSISYFGVCALDAEAYGMDLIIQRNTPIQEIRNNTFGFQSFPGGTVFDINPFVTDQPEFEGYNEKGVFMTTQNGTAITGLVDGFFPSRTTTYDPETNTNGNDMARLPDARYTAGYDAHHYRLPANSMVPNATSAQVTLRCERYGTSNEPCGGGYSIFMAYMAIQTLQPDLKLTMTAQEPSVEPGGVLTYRLKVENIGPLKCNAGAYITNPLPIAVDLIPGSITYLGGKTPPTPPNVAGQSSDAEVITFYLPEIAAGDGVSGTPGAEVEIEYKVNVKGLDRTDIWAYGCNRDIRNVATLSYKTAEGSDITTGSNAGAAGCDGAGVPEITDVVSTDLEAQYESTHIVTMKDEAGNAYQGIVQSITGGTSVNIVTTLKDILRQQYISLGLDLTELPLYTINREGFPVGVGENFIVIEGEKEQLFTANATLTGGCEETFEFRLELISVPDWKEEDVDGINDYTSCAGVSDGELSVVVTKGTVPYSLQVVDAGGTTVYTGFSDLENAQGEVIFQVNGLPKGVYDLVIGDKNSVIAGTVTGQVTVDDPKPIVPEIKSTCTPTGIQLTGSATGGDEDGTFDFVWKNSSGAIVGNGNSLLATTPDTYELIACNGACQNPTAVTVELPVVSVTGAPNNLTTYPANTAIVSVSAEEEEDRKAIFTANPNLAAYTYAWKHSNSLPGVLSGQNTAVLTVDKVSDVAMTGNTYIVELTEAGVGCVGTAQGELVAVEAPVIKLVGSTKNATCPDAANGEMTVTIEKGDISVPSYPVVLKDALGTVVYTLSGGYTAPAQQTVNVTGLKGESAPIGTAAPENPVGTGIYTWEVTDPIVGLIKYGPWEVKATPRPIATLEVDDACYGEEVIATASGTPEPVTYEWTINGTVDGMTDGANYVYTYDIPATPQGSTVKFEVVAQSIDFCRSLPQEKTITLIAVPDPLMQKAVITDQNPLGIPFAACMQKTGKDWAELVDNPPVLPDYPNGFELMWYDVPMGGIGTMNPELLNLGIPGEYVKYVSAVNDGCPSLRTPINAVVYANPMIVSIDRKDLQSVIIKVTGTNPDALFELDYEGTRRQDHHQFEINSTVSNPFTLGQHHFLVIDENKCQVEGLFNIDKTVLAPMPYFSPNGDEDVDIWKIEHLDAYLDSHITIEIFDREGKRLFYSTGTDFEGWDGRFNGRLMPSTDYWYNIYIEETDERFVGSFTLKR